MRRPAYLVLENGKVFEGQAFGHPGEVTGEIVFTTAMTGYLETLTDPSYYGQIIVQTFPLIGNYGVIPADFESDRVAAKGYIVKEWCQEPSNFRCEGDLDAFLKQQGVVGLYGIDTRALTRILREHGVMNGRIVLDPAQADPKALATYRATGAVAAVSTKQTLHLPAEHPRLRVTLWDFGTKGGIERELQARGCEINRVPHDATVEQILQTNPQGIMLSNGPGDPRDNVEIIDTLRGLIDSGIPMFGICMGHQLLALAHGFASTKMKYGHRGENQPVQDMSTGQVYITSQNHGYAILNESIDPAKASLLYRNVNDGTCEGILYKNKPVFSAQFHPEACGGPLDTGFLFDRFITMMEEKHAAQ